MTMDKIAADLAVFADLGTKPPTVFTDGARSMVRMYRGGRELELEFHDNGEGRIVERVLDENETRGHANYRALLASDNFGNLRKWVESQQVLLKGTAEPVGERLQVYGKLTDSNGLFGPEELDEVLVTDPITTDQVRIMLIDGPAGIGKTRFIENLAYQRARDYWKHQRPVILHVESRGRVLTFIQDLIAFSLQRMRLSVTFDQVPILVRNGLVTLAIDGFDELGDPSGYEHAWGQLNDLITEVRGGGTVLLAGRDTFVGRDRIRRDVRSLRESDTVDSLSLQPPQPADARKWLTRHGWTNEDIDSTSELFEAGSYALRPFFLAQLANKDVASTVRNKLAGTPLAFLVDLMIDREIGKFGDVIEGVMSVADRKLFVQHLLRETARFMADDQAEAIDELALAWIVELVAPDDLGPELLNILRNRAGVVAFLTNDSARNHRRFAHSQLFNHFLGDETIDLVGEREVPKYLRRNIVAADFLVAFGDLLWHTIHINELVRVSKFIRSAAHLINSYESYDRAPRNLGALLMSTLPVIGYFDDVPTLGPFHVDEAVIKDATTTATTLQGVAINQLDARGSDLRQLVFQESVIVTLIANDATRLSSTFPRPSLVQWEGINTRKTIVAPAEIATWLRERQGGRAKHEGHEGGPITDAEHPLMKLLERACRNRSYWIKQTEEDIISGRLVRDENWNTLVELLRQHGLVREERKQSGGQSAQFLHIKRPMDILMKVPGDSQIEGFYRSLQVAVSM